MRPLEAYETVMRFAAERGEPALRLALHAAVPQSFRPGFLHLLRLNFVPEAAHETEADILLAPFCEDTGGGYYQFDPEARRLLLDHLDPTYPAKKVSRLQRVADFLVTYIESQRRRLSADQDRLAEDYLSIQSWVALAFLRPEVAAMQLAAALDQGTQGEVAARVQFSGLASALSVPLVKYPRLLTYAAGLEALEQGRAADAAALLERLPDEEIKIEGVTLRSPRKLLTKQEGASQEQQSETVPAPSYGSCFISYPLEDRVFVDWLRPALQSRGIVVRTAPDDFEGHDQIAAAVQAADNFLLVLSKRFRSSSGSKREVHIAQEVGRPIISLMIDPPEMVLGKDVPAATAIDFSHRNYEQGLATLLQLLETLSGSSPRTGAAAEEQAPSEGVIPGLGTWNWLKAAGFDYHCYISWAGRLPKELVGVVEQLVAALNKSLGEYFDPAPQIFFDRHRLVMGGDWLSAHGDALYHSVAMVALYTPEYGRPGGIGGREWAAMEQLGRERLPSGEQGLIIPVILRGSANLPEPVRRVQYLDLEKVGLKQRSRSGEISRAAERIAKRIREIADILESSPVRARSVTFELPSRSAFEPREGGIYLSYSREDGQIAQSLRSDLERAGVGVRMLADMEKVDENRLREQIELSTVFVALLSRHTLISGPQVSRIERDLAAGIAKERGSSRFVIVPVVLDDIDLGKVELPYVFYTMDALYTRDQYPEGLIKSLLALVRELEGGAQRPLPR